MRWAGDVPVLHPQCGDARPSRQTEADEADAQAEIADDSGKNWPARVKKDGATTLKEIQDISRSLVQQGTVWVMAAKRSRWSEFLEGSMKASSSGSASSDEIIFSPRFIGESRD